MQKIHILVITYFYPPSQTAEAICSANTISALADIGYKITVITSDNPSQLSDFEYRKLVPHNINVITVPDPNRAGNSRMNKLKRMMSLIPDVGSLWVKEAVNTAISFTRNSKCSVIYTRSMPGASAIAALKIKENTKIPWIAHFSDPWPFAEHVHRPATHNYLLNWYFNQILDKADGISFTCKACINYIERQYNKKTKRKNIFITSHIAKLINTDNNDVQTTKNHFNLVHAGTFYGARTPFTLLRGFSNFVKTCEGAANAKLTLIGSSKWNLEIIAKELGISPNVEIMGERGLTETQNHMRKASALLLVEAEQKLPVYLPSKLAEYTLLEKPILALTPNDSPVWHLLQDDPFAFCIPPSDENALCSALCNLIKLLLTSSTQNGNRTLHANARNEFSKDKVLKGLTKHIDYLAGTRNPYSTTQI